MSPTQDLDRCLCREWLRRPSERIFPAAARRSESQRSVPAVESESANLRGGQMPGIWRAEFFLHIMHGVYL